MTYLGRVTVIQHALVGMQFYDMPWSGCSFITCPGADAAGHSYSTCPGQDVVLRHVLVRTQYYDISGS